MIGSPKVIAVISTPGLECKNPGVNPGGRTPTGRQGLRPARTEPGLKVAAREVGRRLPGAREADRRLAGAGRRLAGAGRGLPGDDRRLPGAVRRPQLAREVSNLPGA